MKYLPKILLIVSSTMFVVSVTTAGSNIHYGMLKPLSAIFFIVFFILHVTQREVARFDEEEHRRLRIAAIRRPPASRKAAATPNPVPKPCGAQVETAI